MNLLENLRIDPAKLKQARGNRTLKQVAGKVNVSRAQISMIETGKSQPSSKVLIKLCALYGIDLSNITTDSPD